MANRLGIAIGAVLLAMTIALPAAGQTAAAPAPADLGARLKELEGNPRQQEALYKAGRKVAAFCANCHGDGGNSVKPDVPNLAGQNVYFLLDQLRQLSDGRRKTSEFKQRLVKVLTPDETLSMVTFYSGQDVTSKPWPDAAMVGKGAQLYRKHCADCHEENGRGNRKYARVAGQQTGYLTASLKRFRDGTGTRINRPKAAEFVGMTDADIGSLVAYVSSMK